MTMLPRVLIVDDNDDFRMMLKEYLQSHDLGIELFEASSGEMGVAKASFINADIVIMDISLPNENGLKAAQFIKEENPACQTIILTMFEVDLFKKAAQRIEAADFIGKSEVYDRLVPALKRCLKETETRRRTFKKNP